MVVKTIANYEKKDWKSGVQNHFKLRKERLNGDGQHLCKLRKERLKCGG